MRAAVLEAPGRALQVETIPIPEPKAGEVLVKVAACGVCHTDLHVIKGEVAFPTPAVLGHEISGTVVALGPGVAGPAVGTRVVSSFIMPCGTCHHCAAGRDDLCDAFFSLNRLKGVLYDGTTRLYRSDGKPLAMYSMGGLAEYTVVPATDVFSLPDALPLTESAVIGCAIFTAYGAVRHAGDVAPGDTVAVVAVGGVGSNVVQIARAFGAAEIIAVDVRPDKLEAATALGATETVDASREDPVARVRAITGGRGVDVAFEALGRARTFVQALEMVKDGGRMVAVGIAPGRESAPVEITRVVRRGIRIVGSYGARTRTDMPRILDMTERGLFRPERMVTRRFSLEQADEAYRLLDRGEIVGRAIVSMQDGAG
ncbi:MAG: zinc-binding dehydrogenase [Limnochordaceae bacterium]|nr:zinc-binding dehydrogenase [Limnochordaceae bacterium]